MARIAAVQLRVPDLPDDATASRLCKADELLRFNSNHYPAGSSRGGQFAPAEDATMDAVDSSADVTRQKFSNEDDAARHALKYIYEASKRGGHRICRDHLSQQRWHVWHYGADDGERRQRPAQRRDPLE
jgi:hypothetical protein